MNELLAETVGVGVGGETPYRTGNSPTPPPRAHTITCFGGIATGDLVDAQSPGRRRVGRRDQRGLRPRDRHRQSAEHQGERRRSAGARLGPAFDDFLPAELRNAGAGPAPAAVGPRRNPLARW